MGVGIAHAAHHLGEKQCDIEPDGEPQERKNNVIPWNVVMVCAPRRRDAKKNGAENQP